MTGSASVTTKAALCSIERGLDRVLVATTRNHGISPFSPRSRRARLSAARTKAARFHCKPSGFALFSRATHASISSASSASRTNSTPAPFSSGLAGDFDFFGTDIARKDKATRAALQAELAASSRSAKLTASAFFCLLVIAARLSCPLSPSFAESGNASRGAVSIRRSRHRRAAEALIASLLIA